MCCSTNRTLCASYVCFTPHCRLHPRHSTTPAYEASILYANAVAMWASSCIPATAATHSVLATSSEQCACGRHLCMVHGSHRGHKNADPRSSASRTTVIAAKTSLSRQIHASYLPRNLCTRASWRGAVLDTMSFVLRPVSDNDVVSLFELETGERLWFLRVTGASDSHCSQHPIPPMKRRHWSP